MVPLHCVGKIQSILPSQQVRHIVFSTAISKHDRAKLLHFEMYMPAYLFHNIKTLSSYTFNIYKTGSWIITGCVCFCLNSSNITINSCIYRFLMVPPITHVYAVLNNLMTINWNGCRGTQSWINFRYYPNHGQRWWYSWRLRSVRNQATPNHKHCSLMQLACYTAIKLHTHIAHPNLTCKPGNVPDIFLLEHICVSYPWWMDTSSTLLQKPTNPKTAISLTVQNKLTNKYIKKEITKSLTTKITWQSWRSSSVYHLYLSVTQYKHFITFNT